MTNTNAIALNSLQGGSRKSCLQVAFENEITTKPNTKMNKSMESVAKNKKRRLTRRPNTKILC